MIESTRRMVYWLARSPAGRAAAAAGIGVLVVCQQLMTVGGNTPFSHTLNDAMHIPWFAVLAVLLMRVLNYPSWPVMVVVCVSLAGGTEFVQIFTGRDASLFDVGRDLLGALPVIVVMELTRRRGLARARVVGAAWAGAALLIAGMTLEPPARVYLACRAREQAAPGTQAFASARRLCREPPGRDLHAAR